MYTSTLEAPVLVVGAAHVVDVGAPLRRVLGGRALDAIAVELDSERAARVLAGKPEAAGGSDAPFFLRLWSVLQRRLGAQIGAGEAGAEMKAAADFAHEASLPLFLIDDPIRETLTSLLRSMSGRERVSLLVGALVGLLIPSRLVERQLDRYNEAPSDYLEEVRRVYPGVARVLLDDRNEHMADRLAEIRRRGYGRVAAVVGDAHVAGLAGALRRRGVPVETCSFGALRAVRGPSAGSS